MSITLFCVVQGTSTPFPVDIDRSLTVGHLKKAIKAQKPNDFASIDADKLKLWKVEIPDDHNDLLANLALQDKDELKATKKIRKCFPPQPLDDCIHVIVEVPTAFPLDKKKKHTKRPRTFASSNRTYQDINYYLEPTIMIEKLVKFLLDGKFSLFYGHHQSGKSTTAYAVKEWLEDKYNKEVYVATFSSGIVVNGGLNQFWNSVCAKMESLNADRFKYQEFPLASSNTFESLFSRRNNPSAKDCIIIFDEASYLADNQEIIESFVSSLRVLKDGRDQFNVVSFMLVGTEIIREFLLSHQRPNSVSIISPFSDEASTVSSRFATSEISLLLLQYCTENNFNIDIQHIAQDIYELTFGHKGLVGVCCSFLETIIMEGKNQLTIDEWIEATYMLPEFIRRKATYQSIIRTLPGLSEERKQILANVLRSQTVVASHDNPDVKFLLTEGMIIVERRLGSGEVVIQCAAPILRNIIIYQIAGPNIDLSKSPKPDNAQAIDSKWMLERTIENLSVQHIFTDKTRNSGGEPSEYAFQAEFITVMKNLLSAAYPEFFYRVLPEVKEYDDNGNRRQRLDILIKDGMCTETFGFELVVGASQKVFDEHCERSKKYAEIHDCSMLMVNICPDKKLTNYFGPNYENVTTAHVVYDESKGRAEVVYKDRRVNLSILSASWQDMFLDVRGR